MLFFTEYLKIIMKNSPRLNDPRLYTVKLSVVRSINPENSLNPMGLDSGYDVTLTKLKKYCKTLV